VNFSVGLKKIFLKKTVVWLFTGDGLHDPLDGGFGKGGPAEDLVPVELLLRQVGYEDSEKKRFKRI
jgi:hypothetical protein